MENFIFSLGVVTPTCLIALLGFILRKTDFFNDAFLKQLDKYVFQIAIPLLMVCDVARSDIRSMFDLKFALFCFIATTLSYWGLYIVLYPFMKNKTLLASFCHASGRGSITIFGASLTISICGSAGYAPLMMAVVVPLYNIYGVVLMSLKSENGQKIFSKSNLKSIGKSIITNKIIIGILVGTLISFLGINIPEFLFKPMKTIASTGSPLALISLGAGLNASLKMDKIKANFKPVIAASFMKLVGHLLIFMPIAVMMGMNPDQIVSVLVMLGTPCTVTAYIVAKSMGGDYEFTSATVLVSTILSTVTMTLWLTVLKSMALI